MSEENSKWNIRRVFDEKNSQWYFSVIDVIGIVTKSMDARNYWKVLKNRLKKAQNELVTKCNQLKMRSKDGKSYLTDVADAETILQIIKSISPLKVWEFREYFESLPSLPILSQSSNNFEEQENTEAKLLVDVYQTNDAICIESMIAGVEPENVSIHVTPRKVFIKGKREKPILSEDYLHQELYWLNFSRTISLPCSVQVDKVEKKYERGHLVIKIQKLVN